MESSCQVASVSFLKYDHKKRKLPLFIANPRDWVSLKLKFAILGQNWKEIIFLRHQKIIAPLDGIDGSKAVDYTLLEVSEKVKETKRKNS